MERHSSQTWFRKDIILRHGRPFVRLGLLVLELQQEIGSHHRHLDIEEDLFHSCFQLLPDDKYGFEPEHRVKLAS